MGVLIAVLCSPYQILRWLFKHNPLLTLVELAALSAIHAFVIIPVIAFFLDKGALPTTYAIGIGAWLGFLSVIFASRIVDGGGELEVNDYDVLALTVRDYLISRGQGIICAYIIMGGLGFVFYLLVSILVSLAMVLYFTIMK